VLDPEVVVVGGGLVEAGEVLFGPLRQAYLDLVMAGDVRPAVSIAPAALGERANAIGAALLALDQECGT
jgi:glucokinase